MGLTGVDNCMFECCLKDLSARISSNTVMRDFRARRRLFRQCEEARRNLFEGREYANDIVSLCQEQDYQCAVKRVDHTELREGWSTCMKLLKGAVETDLTI